MHRFFLLVFILFAGTWLGLKVYNDPGYALIAYNNWSAEMPFWLVVLAWFCSLWLFYAAARCFYWITHAKKNIAHWRRQQQEKISRQQTTQGLLALAIGDYAKTEKILLPSAGQNDIPLLNYLVAAQAAQAQGADARRDDYLQRALIQNPKDTLTILLLQTQLQIDKKQFEQALATLKQLQAKFPRHPRVLALLAHIYQANTDWEALENLLPSLVKQKIFTDKQLAQTRAVLYENLLLTNIHPEKIWDRLTRNERKQVNLIYAYARGLMNQNQPALAEKILKQTLDQQWLASLFLLYSEIAVTDPQKQLAIAEQWIKAHPNDPDLLYYLGVLCMQINLWGKARSYFATSLSLKPQAKTFKMSALLAEKLGEVTLANQYYRDATLKL